jgi:hypothetical protein
MEFGPHARFRPIAKLPPTAHATAAAEFLRQHLPRDTASQHEQDAGQRLPVAHRLAAGIAKAPRFRCWQKWFDQIPKHVVHDQLGHRRTSLYARILPQLPVSE